MLEFGILESYETLLRLQFFQRDSLPYKFYNFALGQGTDRVKAILAFEKQSIKHYQWSEIPIFEYL